MTRRTRGTVRRFGLDSSVAQQGFRPHGITYPTRRQLAPFVDRGSVRRSDYGQASG